MSGDATRDQKLCRLISETREDGTAVFRSTARSRGGLAVLRLTASSRVINAPRESRGVPGIIKQDIIYTKSQRSPNMDAPSPDPRGPLITVVRRVRARSPESGTGSMAPRLVR